MRTTAFVFSVILVAGLPTLAVEAQAQTTRATELPGNDPTKFYSTSQRNYVQGYVRQRMVPSVQYRGQLEIGTQIPSTHTYYDIEGDPSLTGYRYARFNERYVVVDQNGRVIDVIE
jgi:Protein of unknown function (DUF1236)